MKMINNKLHLTPYELQLVNDGPDIFYIDHHKFGKALRLIPRPENMGSFHADICGVIDCYVWGLDAYYKDKWIIDENN